MNSFLQPKLDQQICPACGSINFNVDSHVTCRNCGLVVDEEPLFLQIPDRHQSCERVQFSSDTVHTIGNRTERQNSKFMRLHKLNSQAVQSSYMVIEQTALNCFKTLHDRHGEKKYYQLKDYMNLFKVAYTRLPKKSRCRNPEVLALAVFIKAHEYLHLIYSPFDTSTGKLFFNVAISTFHKTCLAIRTAIFKHLDKMFQKTRSVYYTTKNEFRIDETAVNDFKNNFAKYIHIDNSFFQVLVSCLIKNKHRAELGKKTAQRLAVVAGVIFYKLGYLPMEVRLMYLAKTAHMNQENLTKIIYALGDSRFGQEFVEWTSRNTSLVEEWKLSFQCVGTKNKTGRIKSPAKGIRIPLRIPLRSQNNVEKVESKLEKGTLDYEKDYTNTTEIIPEPMPMPMPMPISEALVCNQPTIVESPTPKMMICSANITHSEYYDQKWEDVYSDSYSNLSHQSPLASTISISAFIQNEKKWFEPSRRNNVQLNLVLSENLFNCPKSEPEGPPWT